MIKVVVFHRSLIGLALNVSLILKPFQLESILTPLKSRTTKLNTTTDYADVRDCGARNIDIPTNQLSEANIVKRRSLQSDTMTIPFKVQRMWLMFFGPWLSHFVFDLWRFKTKRDGTMLIAALI